MLRSYYLYGIKTVTLTEEQLPKITGEMQTLVPDNFSTSGVITGENWSTPKKVAPNTSMQNTIYGFSLNFGNNEAHTNLQPYLTCYIWKRTA